MRTATYRLKISALALSAAAALVPGLAIAPGPAVADTPACTGFTTSPVTQTLPPPGSVTPQTTHVQIADPACEFDGSKYTGTTFTALTRDNGAALSTVHTGILDDHAAYRIEVPKDWNGTLVMYAHGYRGTGDVVYVDSPQLRDRFVHHGYAWAASSYAKNGYDVGTGVIDTHDLLKAFPSITGKTPSTTIMQGDSMGGAITAVEIEYYRHEHAYDGAMPYCGVVGGNDLFNFFLGANVTSAALTGTDIKYPMSIKAGAAYEPTYQDNVVTDELPKLGITPNSATGGQTFSTDLTHTGTQWRAAVEQLSGGTRPGFASAFQYWNSFGFAPVTHAPFLFGLYPGLTGGTTYYADGNIAGNKFTTYRLNDGSGQLSVPERRLNANVLRVARTATHETDPHQTELPDVIGDPGIPVLSIHGIGDLFVPFSMDQDYARLMAAHGESSLFVSRAIREVAHCGYTNKELSDGFHDLMQWVNGGGRPAGNDILNPAALNSPHFGCRFTDPTPGAHKLFAGPPCDSPLFGDVSAGNPFATEIYSLATAGVIKGYAGGTFQPTRTISRQAFVTFEMRALNVLKRAANVNAHTGSCGSNETSGYPDVSRGNQFCEQIRELTKDGVINGYADGKFRPTARVSRQAIAAFLFRLDAYLNGQARDASCHTPTPFDDVKATNRFCGDIEWLAGKQITNGYADGGFHPAARTSRQAGAAFLYRFGNAEKSHPLVSGGALVGAGSTGTARPPARR